MGLPALIVPVFRVWPRDQGAGGPAEADEVRVKPGVEEPAGRIGRR